RAELQESGETIEKAVAGAEYGRRAQNRAHQASVPVGRAHPRLALAAGSQVVALAPPGVERAHLDQMGNAGRDAGIDNRLDQLDVHAPETVAAETALVENANEVDRHVVAAQLLDQTVGIEGVELPDRGLRH